MLESAAPQDDLDVRQFNAYLTTWLGESFDKDLSAGKYYKQNFIQVVLGGVECGLSGDTTREGVMKYLIAYETGDPTFVVVANKKGVFNRVTLGHEGEPIPGFYLYTKTPQSESVLLDSEPEWPTGQTDAGPREHRAHPWTVPDLSQAPANALFSLQGQLLAELRHRGVLRTNNPPVGDYAEWLVWRALGQERLPVNSTKSYDLVSEQFGKVQVKARLVSSPAKSGQLQASPFRSEEFDHAAFVLLSAVDFSVVSAVILPLDAVKSRWSWRPQVRGWTVLMNGPTMGHLQAEDITDGLRRAADGLA